MSWAIWEDGGLLSHNCNFGPGQSDPDAVTCSIQLNSEPPL